MISSSRRLAPRGAVVLLTAATLGVIVSHAPTAMAGEGASIAHASKKQKAAARKPYRQALEALEAKKFDEALALFRESYAIVASPNSLLLIARTLVQLGREPEAYRELEAAIDLAEELAKVDDKYKETAESARKELDELSKKIALVVVTPSAQVTLGAEAVPTEALGRPLPYQPGKLQVSIRHTDGRETSEELELVAGERRELSTAPPPPRTASAPAPSVVAPAPSPAPPTEDGVSKRTLAYVAGGFGVLGFGGFVGFTLLGRSANEREGCAASVCPEATLEDAEQSSSYRTLSLVGLGVGVLGLASSTYLFATSGAESEQGAPKTAIAVGPGRVLLHGTF